jgi:hypothetical protein
MFPALIYASIVGRVVADFDAPEAKEIAAHGML